MKIALASKSPSRKEILEQIGVKFEVIRSNFKEESILKNLNPEEYVKVCAEGKIRNLKNPEIYDIIIFADTICWKGNHIYDTPKNELEAKKILTALNNGDHIISTYLGVWMPKQNKKINSLVKTIVKLKNLSEEEIDKYILTKEPIGKAGAYAIQGIGKKIVKSYEGSYYNIQGLPKDELIELLQKCGLEI